MSLINQRQGFRRTRTTHSFWGFDPILTVAVGLLLFIGTLLVYAATRAGVTISINDVVTPGRKREINLCKFLFKKCIDGEMIFFLG